MADTQVTTHDIVVGDTTYILEWTHSDEGDGYITITEACQADEPCEWFINKATVPSWCCVTHRYDGTGDYPAHDKDGRRIDPPDECDFADMCEFYETYDFKEVL